MFSSASSGSPYEQVRINTITSAVGVTVRNLREGQASASHTINQTINKYTFIYNKSQPLLYGIHVVFCFV